jgi:hypothetical protein
VPYN